MQNKRLYKRKKFKIYIILRKKEKPGQVFSTGIHETFKNSGGCFWKQVAYYYVIKN